MLEFLSRFKFVSAAAILAAFVPLSAAHAGDFTWQSSTYNDQGNKGRFTAQLRYGVPETDNVQFDASCAAGSSGRFAALVFGYNTNGHRAGANVSLQVFLDSYRGRLRGTVSESNTEEGVSGVTAHVGFDHPFWEALASGSKFSYRLGGGQTANMGLNGSGSAVRKFIADCKAIHKASNPPQRRPRTTGLSCKQFGKVRSIESKTPVTITFVNRSESHRAVMWINFKGQPIDYTALNPGQSYKVTTYLTHPWMFTDGPGNCIEMYLPSRGATRFDISVPSPVFGPGND